MKVYTRVVISMETLDVISEESYEYTGRVAECKGKSSGGGSSGQVAYPAYIQSRHQTLLDEAINVELPNLTSGNPYEGVESYDPSTELVAVDAAIAAFSGIVGNFEPITDWNLAYEAANTKATAMLDPTQVEAIVDVFEADQVEQVNRALSTFHVGMADIGAVMSSSFSLGDAQIIAQGVRDVDRFRAELTLQRENSKVQFISNAAAQITSMMVSQAEINKTLSAMTIEASRIKIISMKEKYDQDIEINAKEFTWNIEAIQEVANLLGAPAGSISGYSPMSKQQSSLAGSVIGGVIGYAMGGGMGGLVGAGIGGALGGIF